MTQALSPRRERGPQMNVPILELVDVHAATAASRCCAASTCPCPGTVMALLGPNGAGKSTLGRSSAAEAPTSAASTSTACTSRRRARCARPAGLCHIPEGRAVFPNLTVEENLP